MAVNPDIDNPFRNTEAAQLEQGRRIRALHEIISRPDLTFEQQIDATLKLGCQLLGTEIGKVGRQDPEHNISEFLNTVVLSDLPARRGIQLPLDKTFCQVTFTSPEAIAISHASESEYRDHPAVGFLGMQSYIGCSINVHGRKFGTVNFSNRSPVATPFTETDKDLVNLIGSWISVMMERQLEADELKQARDMADRANQAKSVFLAHMSHEIRTPLTAIIGFANAVLDNEQSAEEREAVLKIISSSSNHLLQLINDVLDISKIESGELTVDKEYVDLRQLLSEVEAILRGQAENKGISLVVEYRYPFPEKIPTDALRLKQVLINLVNNAIKFTSHGRVAIQIEYDTNEHVLNIMVSDTGIGLTAEQCENIFKPYVQADKKTARKYGGTGLGLSLSRNLVKMLGGSLEVRSEYGKGSTFTIRHVLHDKDSEQFRLLSGTDNKTGDNSNKDRSKTDIPSVTGSILLAEDSEMNQYLFRLYVEKTGASIDIFGNGELAVDAAQGKNYDLILMDMNMPVMSGVDAVKILKNKGCTTPIVMLTASTTVEDRDLCKQAGADGYITKPIDVPEFYSTLSKYLQDAS